MKVGGKCLSMISIYLLPDCQSSLGVVKLCKCLKINRLVISVSNLGVSRLPGGFVFFD